MKVEELTFGEQARIGATHRVVIKVDDLNGTGTGYGALSASAAANTSGTLKPFAATATGLPSGWQAQFVAQYLKTPFDGGATSAMTAQIGYDVASGTDKAAGYSPAIQVHVDSTEILNAPQEIADVTDLTTSVAALNLVIKQVRKVFDVAQSVDILFTATGANLTALDTGEMHLYFRLVDFSKL